MADNTMFSGPAGRGRPLALDEGDRRLISLLSLDFGRSAAPYLEMAEALGWTEERVIARIKELRAIGAIRRLGAVLVHQRTGFSANAMVVWKIEPRLLDEAGAKLAALPSVSHCYWRPEIPGWPYNLYTMVHAKDHDELRSQVESMAALAGASEWRTLTSLRELKKTSMAYFPQAIPQEANRGANREGE